MTDNYKPIGKQNCYAIFCSFFPPMTGQILSVSPSIQFKVLLTTAYHLVDPRDK